MTHSSSRWDDLCRIFQKTQRVCEEYLSLLEGEEKLVQQMDRTGLSEILGRKEQVLDSLCRYEREVENVLQALVNEQGYSSWADWLEREPSGQADVVQDWLGKLRHLARQIHNQGKTNEIRIRRSQHVVREAVNLIYAGVGSGPVYQGSGTLRTPSVLSSVQLQG